MEKTKHKVSRGMHYTTMIALVISNLSVLALGFMLAGPVGGWAAADLAYWGEYGKLSEPGRAHAASFARAHGLAQERQGGYIDTKSAGYITSIQDPDGVFGTFISGSLDKPLAKFQFSAASKIPYTAIDLETPVEVGRYTFSESMTIDLGKVKLTSDKFDVVIWLDTPTFDRHIVRFETGPFEQGPYEITQAALQLEGYVGTLRDDSLPRKLDLGDFFGASMAVDGYYNDRVGEHGFSIQGRIDDFKYEADYKPGCDSIDLWRVYAAAANLPPDSYVRAGATGVSLGSIRLDAFCEAADIDSIRLAIEDGQILGTANGNYQDSTMTYLYNDSQLLVSKNIPATGYYEWTLPDGALTIPKDDTRYLVVKSDIATIDSTSDNSPGTPAADFRYNYTGDNGFTATGLYSGVDMSVYHIASSTASVVVHKAVPTLTYSNFGNPLGATTALTNGVNNIYNFNVSADSSGNSVLLFLTKFAFETNPYGDLAISECYIKNSDGVTITETLDPYVVGGGREVWFMYDNPDISAGGLGEALEIPAGTSDTYRLFCTIQNAGTGDYLSTSIASETPSVIKPEDHGTPSFIGSNNTLSYLGIYRGSFVWSDNFKNLSISGSNGANATSWGQWYNGYLMPGIGPSGTTYPYTVVWPN